MIVSKFKTLVLAIKGELLKKWLWARRKVIIKQSSLQCSNNGEERVIVSLTSYGRRVRATLPYTILSLLRQTIRPETIIVWLDSTWRDNNLPKNLILFKMACVEFRFCDDMKSFKKLIPSLSAFPKDIIITCDDDLFYNKHMVERLLKAHRKYPNTICCQLAHRIQYCEDKLQPYNKWEEVYDSNDNVFPLGGSGCLYKSTYLYKDVTNYELAERLTPKADDVWFYFMGLLNGANRYVLPYLKNSVIPIDAFYQFFHHGTSLMEDNLSLGMNDKQISAVMDYYSINLKKEM